MAGHLLNIGRWLQRDVPIAPLITFRIMFGLVMVFGTIRFMVNGWVERLFDQTFYFKFYGFEWVPVFDLPGMYAVYGLILLGSLGILLGAFYRGSLVIFLTSFTYAELADASNYLNHYYLVSLLAILMLFLPAHRTVSLDRLWGRCRGTLRIPRWNIFVLQLQLGLVYFFAGIAKLNPDWLLHGMPLAAWLPEHTHWPVIGALFRWEMSPFFFSWAGALYDLTIPVWLSISQTRHAAYLAVILFHGLTGMLFHIGLFPLIMTACTLIFFPPEWHERIWTKSKWYRGGAVRSRTTPAPVLAGALALFFCLQTFLPLRHHLLPGKVLWNEAGYRFSWRVMLVEKHGFARFTIHDACSNRWVEVDNGEYLSDFQEKNMAIQPDFILQYAAFLEEKFAQSYGFCDPVVRADSYVSLNGRPARRFVREGVDLSEISPSRSYNLWIEPMYDD